MVFVGISSLAVLVGSSPLAAIQVFNIPLGKFLLCVALGTVGAILIYDAVVSPGIRRDAQRKARDEVRASLVAGSASGTVRAVGSGVSVSALPVEAAAPAAAVPAAGAAPAPGGDPAATSVHRLDEYAKSLREQQKKLDADRKALVEERQRLEALRRDIDAARERVEAQDRDVAEARMALEARRAALEAAAAAAPAGGGARPEAGVPVESESSLEARRAALEADRERIAREFADVESRRLALDQRERAMAQQREEVDRERAALLEMRKQLASRQESIDQMQRRYAQLLVALEREHAEASRLPEPVRAALETFRQEGEAALRPPSAGIGAAEADQPPPRDAVAGDGASAATADAGGVASGAAEAPAEGAEEADASAAKSLLDAFYAAVPRGTSAARADAMLARLVVEAGLAGEDEVADACALQERAPQPAPSLGAVLMAVGVLDESKLRRLLEHQARRLGQGPGPAPGGA